MANLDPRRTDPGAKFTYVQPDGSERNMTADDDGVVTPRTAYDEAYLDSLDLPVARKAKAEREAATTGDAVTDGEEG